MGVGAAVLAVLGLVMWVGAEGRPARWRARAEAAAVAGDWPAALAAWRVVNASPAARGATLLAQAHAAVTVGRLGEAERSLLRATEADPTAPEPWRLLLQLLRLEDRVTEAQAHGRTALEAVPPAARREVLRDLTFALLAEVPDADARSLLARNADPAGDSDDPDARVALLHRMNAMPRAGDPERESRVGELTAVLARDPGHVAAREALVTALADAGQPERGLAVLEAWPDGPARDARYWRLRGRWDLEFDRRPAAAEAAFRRALDELPHDWRTRVRLARALRAQKREAEARAEADAVARLRERLDPPALSPRLKPEDPDPADLAALAAAVGLTDLSDAWRREVRSPADHDGR